MGVYQKNIDERVALAMVNAKLKTKPKTKFIIGYKGLLSEMYVTGFSEPMEVDGGGTERSVKASSSLEHARVFTDADVEEGLRLTRRTQPTAKKIEVS